MLMLFRTINFNECIVIVHTLIYFQNIQPLSIWVYFAPFFLPFYKTTIYVCSVNFNTHILFS